MVGNKNNKYDPHAEKYDTPFLGLVKKFWKVPAGAIHFAFRMKTDYLTAHDSTVDTMILKTEVIKYHLMILIVSLNRRRTDG